MSEITLAPGRLEGQALAPPSKSYTHRFLLAAHLGGRPCRIQRPLVSADTLRSVGGLRALGTRVRRRRGSWTVEPGEPRRGTEPLVVDCGESGTTLRLLAAAAAIRAEPVRFVGDGRLPLRPMEPLLTALGGLGARVGRAASGRGLPLEIEGPIHGGTVDLAVDVSSQFTSALLFALPRVRPDSRLRTHGAPVSEPYVRATLAVLRRRGVVVRERPRAYAIPGGQVVRPRDESVPGDASSAAYLWAGAAATGGTVTVGGVPAGWPQADLAVLDLLRDYGAEVVRVGARVRVRGGARRPFRIGLDAAPDLYPLAGVLAALAPGRSVLAGGAHVAAKESDRLAETTRLARALGARTERQTDRLVIEGARRPRALRCTKLTDHRLVMSAAIGALAATGPSRIGDARAVAKSFPEFFTVLERLGAEVRAQ